MIKEALTTQKLSQRPQRKIIWDLLKRTTNYTKKHTNSRTKARWRRAPIEDSIYLNTALEVFAQSGAWTIRYWSKNKDGRRKERQKTSQSNRKHKLKTKTKNIPKVQKKKKQNYGLSCKLRWHSHLPHTTNKPLTQNPHLNHQWIVAVCSHHIQFFK